MMFWRKAKLKEITALVLAGGLGTRLKPVVSDRPKGMAEVVGKPFLTYILEQLKEAEVGKVILCTGFKGELIECEFGREYRGIPLEYSQENKSLGTGGALRLAYPKIESEEALVMNGDSYCQANLKRFIRLHRSHEANASILLTYSKDASRFGRVLMEESGRVLKFMEKAEEPGPGWINAGIYLIRKKLVKTIPHFREVSLEREIFPRWIGNRFFGFKNEGVFIDIGTPESYEEAKRLFEGELRLKL